MPTRRHLLQFMMAATLLPAAPAHALTAQERQAVAQVSQFFNGFRTMHGDFTQISPRGRVSTGKLVIAKPGRMRFEYTPPHPLVIVSDGTWVAVRNNAKDKVDYYPLSKTPLKMVLAERVDLLRDAKVKKVERSDGLLLITLQANDKGVPGELLLVFDPARRQLQQWTVIDPQGRRTTITLSNLAFDQQVNPKLFRVKRPGDGRKRRNVKQNFNAGRR